MFSSYPTAQQFRLCPKATTTSNRAKGTKQMGKGNGNQLSIGINANTFTAFRYTAFARPPIPDRKMSKAKLFHPNEIHILSKSHN